MKKKYPSLLTLFLISIMAVTSGCIGDQFGRSGRASTAIGTMGTSEIQGLGSPRKNVYLGKRSLSGEFVIVIPNAEKIYLGQQYNDVVPNGDFSVGQNDFVVLTCYESSSSFTNLLLTIPAAPALAKVTPLYGSLNRPFVLDKKGKKIRLAQETSNPAIKNTWEILSLSDIRGPLPVQGKEAQAIKIPDADVTRPATRKTNARSTSHTRTSSPTTTINKDTSVSLDKPSETTAQPSDTSAKPVIVLEAEPVASPDKSEQPAATIKSEPSTSSQKAEQPAVILDAQPVTNTTAL